MFHFAAIWNLTQAKQTPMTETCCLKKAENKGVYISISHHQEKRTINFNFQVIEGT